MILVTPTVASHAYAVTTCNVTRGSIIRMLHGQDWCCYSIPMITRHQSVLCMYVYGRDETMPAGYIYIYIYIQLVTSCTWDDISRPCLVPLYLNFNQMSLAGVKKIIESVLLARIKAPFQTFRTIYQSANKLLARLRQLTTNSYLKGIILFKVNFILTFFF